MDKRLFRIIGNHFDYQLDLDEAVDGAEAIAAIVDALNTQDGGLVKVPVLDKNKRVMDLYLNPRTIEGVAFDTGAGPKPHEFS
ncbi:hypothetical protein [Amycolatopsis sp. lyj-109]|uniref:hypothetical protein n=1 Tax=Amycolatopsis sp. lyj-109 TaxID=2789287 RepID=UPI00397904E5